MNKSVLITGASSGIGKALATELTKRGWRVLAAGRNKESLNLLRTETGCEIVAMDLFDSKSAVDLYKIAEKKLNGLDALVNGAAMNKRKVPIADIDLSEWRHMALNLRAPMLLCREAMRRMSEGGHIMNIVSSIALTSQINYSIYVATKYALMGFTNTLRKEAQLKGIKVQPLFPVEQILIFVKKNV